MNLAIFGPKTAPGRIPKITENRFFAKKGAPRKAFLSIFAACDVFLDFSFDFGSILSEKSMFFSNAVSSRSARFFRNGDPYDSMVFTIRKPLFHFSFFHVFFEKIAGKSTKKRDPKKQRKNDGSGA